jgi:hypothetical protein
MVTESVQGLLNLYVVRATVEKLDLHAGKMKFNTQNKE